MYQYKGQVAAAGMCYPQAVSAIADLDAEFENP